MDTPLGRLYALSPADLRQINDDAHLNDASKHYHIFNTDGLRLGDEAGRILFIEKSGGHLEITIMVYPDNSI